MSAVRKELSGVSSVECVVSGEYEVGAELISFRAEVKAAKSPDRYWARTEAKPPVGSSYVGWNGSNLLYTDGEGQRQSRELKIPNVVVNWASDPAYRAWETFLKPDMFDSSRYEHTFVALQDEVEGRSCDVVGMVLRKNRPEPYTSIRYYWIDRQTHLPLSMQLHVFHRGKSGATNRIFFANTKLDPKWAVEPFQDVPEIVQATSIPRQAEPQPEGIKVGGECPDLIVQDTDLKEVRLRSLIKGLTLVTFWASWCGPCLKELDALPQVPEVRDGRIKVYAVGVLDGKQSLRSRQADGSTITYLVDPDAERTRSGLVSAFGITGIPRAFLFKDGVLVREWTGFLDLETLIKEIRD